MPPRRVKNQEPQEPDHDVAPAVPNQPPEEEKFPDPQQPIRENFEGKIILEKQISWTNNSVYQGRVDGEQKLLAIKVYNKFCEEAEFQTEANINKILSDDSKVIQVRLFNIKSRSKIQVGQKNIIENGSYIAFDLKKNGDFGNYRYNVFESEEGPKLRMMDEKIARYFFRQMVECIQYIHSQGVAHLDLKPEQFLVEDCFLRIVLADFGHSVQFEENQKIIKDVNKGTPYYRAPETFVPINQEEVGYDPTKADVFSLGCILVKIVIGVDPFHCTDEKCGNSQQCVHSYINFDDNFEMFFGDCLMRLRKQCPDATIPSVSKECQVLLKQMLQFHHQNRVTLEQVQKSAWYQGEVATEDQIQTYMQNIKNKKKDRSEEVDGELQSYVLGKRTRDRRQ